MGNCTSVNFRIFLIFTIVATVSCSLKVCDNSVKESQEVMNKKSSSIIDFSKPSEDSLLVRKITSETAHSLQKKMNLNLIGTGSSMMHEITMLAMSFNYSQEVELEKARELVVSAIREYLQDINASEEIRPYLVHYPFTTKDIEIMIAIVTPMGLPDLGKISIFSCNQGILKYYRKKEVYALPPPFHKESYEEALRLVEEQEKKGFI